MKQMHLDIKAFKRPSARPTYQFSWFKTGRTVKRKLGLVSIAAENRFMDTNEDLHNIKYCISVLRVFGNLKVV